MAAVYVKISGIVEDDTLRRSARNGFSHVPNFYAKLRKNGEFNPRNSKPEVDIDVIPTAFMTLCFAVKYNVINFGQMAPQYA